MEENTEHISFLEKLGWHVYKFHKTTVYLKVNLTILLNWRFLSFYYGL